MRVPFSDPSWAFKRKAFIPAVTGSAVMLQVLFFANMCYLYGVLHNMHKHYGWLNVLMVNFDDGVISEALTQTVPLMSGPSFPAIHQHDASLYTPETIENAVCKGEYWGAIYTTAGASNRLEAGLQGEAYNATNAVTIVYNQVRHTVIEESAIFPLLAQMVSASAFVLQESANSSVLNSLDTSDPNVRSAMFKPISYLENNLAPMKQGPRVLYNTATVVMMPLMQFFFILATMGISTGFGFFTQISVKTNVIFRIAISIPFTLIGSLLMVGYIWIFKEDWAVGVGQFFLTWLVIWQNMFINYIVIDAVAAVITISYVPFFMFTWIITNIASTVMPFEISAGFYKIGYLFPAHHTYEVLYQIWSGHGGKCYNKLDRALPVLFVYMLIFTPLSMWANARRCRKLEAAEAAGVGAHGAYDTSKSEEATLDNRSGSADGKTSTVGEIASEEEQKK